MGDSRTARCRSGINRTLDGVGSSSGVSHSRFNGVGCSRINESVTVTSMGSVAVASVEWVGSVASVELVTPVELITAKLVAVESLEVGLMRFPNLVGSAASIEPDLKQALDYHRKFH